MKYLVNSILATVCALMAIGFAHTAKVVLTLDRSFDTGVVYGTTVVLAYVSGYLYIHWFSKLVREVIKR